MAPSCSQSLWLLALSQIKGGDTWFSHLLLMGNCCFQVCTYCWDIQDSTDDSKTLVNTHIPDSNQSIMKQKKKSWIVTMRKKCMGRNEWDRDCREAEGEQKCSECVNVQTWNILKASLPFKSNNKNIQK